MPMVLCSVERPSHGDQSPVAAGGATAAGGGGAGTLTMPWQVGSPHRKRSPDTAVVPPAVWFMATCKGARQQRVRTNQAASHSLLAAPDAPQTAAGLQSGPPPTHVDAEHHAALAAVCKGGRASAPKAHEALQEGRPIGAVDDVKACGADCTGEHRRAAGHGVDLRHRGQGGAAPAVKRSEA